MLDNTELIQTLDDTKSKAGEVSPRTPTDRPTLLHNFQLIDSVIILQKILIFFK